MANKHMKIIHTKSNKEIAINDFFNLQKCNYLKILLWTGCWWLKPEILATQETEIMRIMVRSQLGQIVLQDPILKKPFTKKGW
jgi:hypothetical protein